MTNKPEVGKLYNAGGVLYECVATDEGECQFRHVGNASIPAFWVHDFATERWTEATRKDILDSIEYHEDRIGLHYIEIEKHDEGIAELKGWWECTA